MTRSRLSVGCLLLAGELALLVSQSVSSAQSPFVVNRDSCSPSATAVNISSNTIAVNMRDGDDLLPSLKPMTSFGLAVGDLNGDHSDDIVFGSHSGGPRIFINQSDGFREASSELDLIGYGARDTHGNTLVDIDDDGDLDIVIACGGADGVGQGCANVVLINSPSESDLSLSIMPINAEMKMPEARSRSFIPTKSPDGKTVDLYFTTLLREGFPNMLLRAVDNGESFQGWQRQATWLPTSINDHGRGTLADFDGDSHTDYFVLEGDQANIYWNRNSGHAVTRLANRVFSATVGDFNNDGDLDIFLGRGANLSGSDHVSHADNELVYVVGRKGDDREKSIHFKAAANVLYFDLWQHVKVGAKSLLRGGKDIYLGESMQNPSSVRHSPSRWESRRFHTTPAQAYGQPADFHIPGVYIWHTPGNNEWHIRWTFYQQQEVFIGRVEGAGITELERLNLHREEAQPISDVLLLNRGAQKFDVECSDTLSHPHVTSGLTAADFNNDGLLDIAGVRRAAPGAENPVPFLLINYGEGFIKTPLHSRDDDQFSQSDLVVHGFFDNDDKPDIVVSNGYGQPPGNLGRPRLLLNQTITDYESIRVRLQGSNANHFAVGAKATLYDGTHSIIGFRVQGLNTNVSQDSHWLHFGLGESDFPLQLVIDWPDNTRSVHGITEAGAHTIVQP